MATELQPQDNSNDGDHKVAVPIERQSSLIVSIGRAIRAGYNPRPMAKPEVDPSLATLPTIERIAEVCRYSLARLEFSLSSGGGLRAWLKLNLLIAIVIAIPALLVMPAITLVLGTFATWAEYLAATAVNLFRATLAAVATAALLTGVIRIFR